MPFLIAITGGSGSGKTTLADRLAELLPGTIVVSEDRYYRDTRFIPDYNVDTHNFDDVAAREYNILIDQLKVLKSGQAVQAPEYCFVTHTRKDGTSEIPAADIIIFEGIHLLYDPNVRSIFDLTIFVDTPHDLRFIRRLLRDTRPESEGGRGRDWRGVVGQYLDTVRKSHTLFTEPGRAVADIVIIDESDGTKIDNAKLDELLIPVLKAIKA